MSILTPADLDDLKHALMNANGGTMRGGTADSLVLALTPYVEWLAEMHQARGRAAGLAEAAASARAMATEDLAGALDRTTWRAALLAAAAEFTRPVAEHGPSTRAVYVLVGAA